MTPSETCSKGTTASSSMVVGGEDAAEAFNAALEASREVLGSADIEAWAVGGCVRDWLLGNTSSDLDLAVAADSAAISTVARKIARALKASVFPLSDSFGAWRITSASGAIQVDLTPLQGANIDDDLSARDLTINAIARPLGSEVLIDPFSGEKDLNGRLLRAVSETSFSSDPVRVLRLARFAAQTGFAADQNTLDLAKRAAPAIALAAGERMLPELQALLSCPGWMPGLQSLKDSTAMEILFPDALSDEGELSPEALSTMALLRAPSTDSFPFSDDQLALIAKRETKNSRLALDLAALNLKSASHSPLAIFKPSKRLSLAVSRYIKAARELRQLLTSETFELEEVFACLNTLSEDAPEAVLFAAAVTHPHDQQAEERFELLMEKALTWAQSPPVSPISGDVLQVELGIKPGPELGKIIKALTVAAATDKISSHSEALKLARELSC